MWCNPKLDCIYYILVYSNKRGKKDKGKAELTRTTLYCLPIRQAVDVVTVSTRGLFHMKK